MVRFLRSASLAPSGLSQAYRNRSSSAAASPIAITGKCRSPRVRATTVRRPYDFTDTWISPS
jgi:hypothetical protein